MTAMEIQSADRLPAIRIILPRRHEDTRGFLSEVWRQDAMRDAGIDIPFVQENHTFSLAVGTIRGLHFQIEKGAQAKLIRCTRGSILDVAVDIRRGSPSFGYHVAIVLSERNWKQIFIPRGFAHGFCTLEPKTEVVYKVSAYYDPASERGLAWDDPALTIAWPVEKEAAMLAEKDRTYPRLAELPDFFRFTDFPD
jgi:dTDP-4-dehydrorhamnose 3,5-epimerase